MLAAELGRRTGAIVPPEAQFFMDGVRAANREGGGRELEVFARVVCDHWRTALWIPAGGARDNLRDELASALTLADAMKALVDRYRTVMGLPSSAAWIDHTPSNVMYAHTLLGVFPEAPMIHLVRDPRAVASSVIPLDWGPSTARGAAGWWMSRTAAGLAAESAFGNRVKRVLYEELLLEPDRVFAEILEWLAEYVLLVAPLRESGMRLSSYTAKQHALVGGPIDATRATAWRAQLSSHDIAIIEGEVQDLLPLLGYATDGVAPAERVPRRPEEILNEASRALLNRGRAQCRRTRAR